MPNRAADVISYRRGGLGDTAVDIATAVGAAKSNADAAFDELDQAEANVDAGLDPFTDPAVLAKKKADEIAAKAAEIATAANTKANLVEANSPPPPLPTGPIIRHDATTDTGWFAEHKPAIVGFGSLALLVFGIRWFLKRS